MSEISLSWPYPKLFAHRGAGRHAPENTLIAMKHGYALGYSAVEFDAKLSMDNIGLLLHDDTLERTTNGKGLAKEKLFEALVALDAGSWHSSEFAGETIPSLAGVIDFLLGNNMIANVEIKPCKAREQETGERIAKMCMGLWAGSTPPLISSFSLDALQAARKVSATLPMGYLVKEPKESDFAILDELSCVSFHFAHQFATQALVDQIHDSGRKVMLYTVNDVERAKVLFDFGVDGIFTDELAVFAEAFPVEYRTLMQEC